MLCHTSVEEDSRGNDHFPVCIVVNKNLSSIPRFVHQIKIEGKKLIHLYSYLEATKEDFEENYPPDPLETYDFLTKRIRGNLPCI